MGNGVKMVTPFLFLILKREEVLEKDKYFKHNLL